MYAITYKDSKTPWASICIPTYRRQDLLRETLNNLTQQTMPDFEVIISDNDPTGSSQSVVKEFKDPRFKYFRNQENVGMVKNTNLALIRAEGEFVVTLPDDDTLYPEMLATLQQLVEQQPGFGAYFGAMDLNVMTPEVAWVQGTPLGKTSFVAPNFSLGAVRIYTSKEFPFAYLSYQIFPAVFWAAGIVRRSIALEVGGMPDYGSTLMFDHAYLLRVGAKSGLASINLPLCSQNMHGMNATYGDFKQIISCVQGFYQYLSFHLSKRDDWPQLRRALEKYLGNFIVGYSMTIRRYNKLYGAQESPNLLLLRLFRPPLTRPIFWKYLLAAQAPMLFPYYQRFKQQLMKN